MIGNIPGMTFLCRRLSSLPVSGELYLFFYPLEESIRNPEILDVYI